MQLAVEPPTWGVHVCGPKLVDLADTRDITTARHATCDCCSDMGPHTQNKSDCSSSEVWIHHLRRLALRICRVCSSGGAGGQQRQQAADGAQLLPIKQHHGLAALAQPPYTMWQASTLTAADLGGIAL